MLSGQSFWESLWRNLHCQWPPHASRGEVSRQEETGCVVLVLAAASLQYFLLLRARGRHMAAPGEAAARSDPVESLRRACGDRGAGSPQGGRMGGVRHCPCTGQGGKGPGQAP